MVNPLHQRPGVRRLSPRPLAALVVLGLLAPGAASAAKHQEAAAATPVETSTNPPAQAGASPPAEPVATPPTSAAPPTEASGAPPLEEERRVRNAHRRATRNGRCSISLDTTADTITAGDPATLLGALSCPEGTSAAEQTVTVYRKLARTPGFQVAGTTQTTADGSYRFTPLALNTNSVFYVRSAGAKSARQSVKVATLVTLNGPADGTQLIVGGGHSSAAAFAGAGTSANSTVTFSGTVSPSGSGAVVALQREAANGNESWKRIGQGHVDGDGKYSITHTFVLPGQANVRVVVRSHGMNLTSASTPLSYEILRRQNQRLTIQASADPISFGQPLTISGVLAGGAAQPVTLLARTGGGGFAPVAQAVTNGSGGYTFPQSPSQTSFYRVLGGHYRSAILSEGVRYALTVLPPATTVQAGQPLSFSGTLAPAAAGQAVYLERRNSSGVGFHVVASGSVSAGSSYSIVDIFDTPGPEVLRIKVPGDSENLGVSSEPLNLEVTPAPPA